MRQNGERVTWESLDEVTTSQHQKRTCSGAASACMKPKRMESHGIRAWERGSPQHLTKGLPDRYVIIRSAVIEDNDGIDESDDMTYLSVVPSNGHDTG